MADMIYCWGCGKEIHKTAAICPHCGADQKRSKAVEGYTSYTEVPWYRKNWFAILTFFLFMPALFLVLVTGPVYYERRGEIRRYSTLAKIILIAYSGLATLIFIGAILGGVKDRPSSQRGSSAEPNPSASTYSGGQTKASSSDAAPSTAPLSAPRVSEVFSHFVSSIAAPLLPAGAVAGWALHQLESAALSRRTS